MPLGLISAQRFAAVPMRSQQNKVELYAFQLGEVD